MTIKISEVAETPVIQVIHSSEFLSDEAIKTPLIVTPVIQDTLRLELLSDDNKNTTNCRNIKQAGYTKIRAFIKRRNQTPLIVTPFIQDIGLLRLELLTG
ncbi:hypothetical protein PoB_005181500 [Plakobranchus ocellatus]|uniref:Uncharacterized protein n=1 Tax=Plakobranchus ocellatus TaxID=259542 RepID=A0AAV4C121_9GAST|nr:hypothetical protein PoB_005181500 [Plakobranchus ocellatus]